MTGWVANLLILIAIYYIGQRRRIGWVFSIIGNLLWCIYAVQLDLWSALFIDGVTLILAVYNWKKWSDDS